MIMSHLQIQQVDNVCNGLEFLIQNGAKKTDSIEEMENMVKRHGGRVVKYPGKWNGFSLSHSSFHMEGSWMKVTTKNLWKWSRCKGKFTTEDRLSALFNVFQSFYMAKTENVLEENAYEIGSWLSSPHQLLLQEIYFPLSPLSGSRKWHF